MIKVSEPFLPINKRFNDQYNLKKVLDILGNPEKNIPTINIVGTNGKGSTSFYLSKGLLKKYKKVGLFISPAFLYQNERIQINNEMISDEDLYQNLSKIEKYISEYNLTFFEIWTLMMILYFSDQKVDVAVVEAGIGGIKDSTNLMSNQLLTLLTSVSIDHTEVLGNSVEEILKQKVGIVKNNSTLIVSYDNVQLLENIKEITSHNTVILANQIEDKIEYQKSNKGLVKMAFDFLNIEADEIFELNPPLGRFTILSSNPYFIIDGAHNENGIEKLIQTTKELNQEFIVLFASSLHKDFSTNLQKLKNNFKELYITKFEHIKSWDFDLISYEKKVDDWKEFLTINKNKNILVCGSLYFIPQVYEWYNSNEQKG